MDYDATSNPSGSPLPPPEGRPGAREVALAREPGRLRRALKVLGPGLISGASDDDPATIGTCAQLGASLGYATLWTMPLIVPLMIAVQYLTAKIGLVTGRGLAGVLRQHYPRWLLYPLVFGLVGANTLNAGADLGAVADALTLIVPGVSAGALVIPVAAVIVALQLWGSYHLIEKTFKWLTLSLLAYVGAAFLSRPDARQVLRATFIPTLSGSPEYLQGLLAVAGTTFSPYLYFWQSSQEVEEKVAMGRKKLWQRKGTTEAELKYAALDVNIGMTAATGVTYAVILATAATLYRPGHPTDVETAGQAARALEPLAGPAARYLLAAGLIGAGFLAVPVLTTSAAYALSEAFGWKRGLDAPPSRAPRFYAIIGFSTLVAIELNYLGFNPMRALYWTSVIYGFMAPPLLLVVMLVSTNRAIMGRRTSGRLVNFLGWASVVLTFAALAGLLLVGTRRGSGG